MKHPTFDYTFPLRDGPQRYAHMVRLFQVAERMRALGIRLDVRRTEQHRDDARARAATFTRLFLKLTGVSRETLGLSGAGQTDAVKEWFRKAGAPDVIFSKVTKKAQFNAPALTIWAKDYPGAPFSQPAAALLGLRKAKTCVQFATAYLEVAAQNAGRIHFGFYPLGTKTGRWSASANFAWRDAFGELTTYGLNAQNVPSKSVSFDFGDESRLPLMVSLRDCFIPDPGCVWGKCDFEALEARLIAYVTGAKRLMAWIDDGADIHMENAKGLFTEARIPREATKGSDGGKWKPFREAAKPCVYALTYQAPSDRGNDKYPDLFKTLKQVFPDLQETYFKEVCARFFKLHPEIRGWQRSVGDALDREGSVVVPQSGLRLFYPNTMRGRNQAQNLAFQGGGAALINRAIVKIDDELIKNPGKSAILAQVHDELSFQIDERHVEQVSAMVEGHMGAPMQFGDIMGGVPAAMDVGPNWGACVSRETTVK